MNLKNTKTANRSKKTKLTWHDKVVELKSELESNELVMYWRQIESGEQLVNQKIKLEVKKLMKDIIKCEKKRWEWEYDPAFGDYVIEFVEKFCRHSKSEWAGKPIKLELWQKAFIHAVYSFVHKKGRYRKHRLVQLFIPRKAGKSLIASALALYHLFEEEGAELYSAATTYKQAGIVYEESMKMLKKSPDLLKRAHPTKLDITVGDARFRPLASDSHSLDGLNPSWVCCDEVHAWEGRGGTALYDVLVDAQIARKQAMTFVISTFGFVRGSIFDTLYELIEKKNKGEYKNERMISWCYELDDPLKNVHDHTKWPMVQPMLGVTIELDQLRDLYVKAVTLPSEMPNFLTKMMNVRSAPSTAWLQPRDYANVATWSYETHKFRYCIAGVDLSRTDDWTAAVTLSQRFGDDMFYVDAMFWITRAYYEANTASLPLDTWIGQGYLRISEGVQIDPKEVADWIMEQQTINDNYIYKVGYDRYASDLMLDKLKENLSEKQLTSIAQGAMTLSSPMYTLAGAFKAKRINYKNNPILRMHIANTTVKSDDNGNIKPIKGTDKKKKIDGSAALLNCMVVYVNNAEEYQSMI